MSGSEQRVEKLLALLLLQSMGGSPQKEKIVALNVAGFSNVEIADILQTTTQVVAKEISIAKKRSAPRPR